MKHCLGKWSIVAAPLLGGSLLAVWLFASKPAASQNAATDGKPSCVGCSVDGKTTPRTPDGHPNLNGYWDGAPPQPNAAAGGNFRGRQFERLADGSILFDFSTDYNDETGGGRLCLDDSCQLPNQPPYKPEYMAKVKKIAATEYGGTTPLDPQMDCRPMGVPRTGINSMHIVQTPETIAILYEAAPYSTFRLIYTDGRPHPSDLETSFMGDSIGHWEGDTLVVDVTGLNDETWLGGGDAVGRLRYTSIHSDKEHVVERWTRQGDTLTYEATVDDPVVLTKPWVVTPRRVQHAGAGDALPESICTPDYKEHLVKPSENDIDIKTKCGYRCADNTTKTKK